jgi:DNA-binding NtrC family response regulator
MPELLLADIDKNTRALCTQIAKSLDCNVLFALNRDSVLALVEGEEIGVVVLDAATISDHLELTKSIKKRSARTEVLIADERATITAAVAAIKAGATNYLEKPLNEVTLESAISQAFDAYRNFQGSVRPLDELERQAIEDALAQAKGDKLEAARLLSIGKTTLYRKLREYGRGEQQAPAEPSEHPHS